MDKKVLVGFTLVLLFLFIAGCGEQNKPTDNQSGEQEIAQNGTEENAGPAQPGLVLSNCIYDSQEKVIRVTIENQTDKTAETFTISGESVDGKAFSFTTTEPLGPGGSFKFSSAIEVRPAFVEASSEEFPEGSNRVDCS